MCCPESYEAAIWLAATCAVPGRAGGLLGSSKNTATQVAFLSSLQQVKLQGRTPISHFHHGGHLYFQVAFGGRKKTKLISVLILFKSE
jgi:hypothetical protein